MRNKIDGITQNSEVHLSIETKPEKKPIKPKKTKQVRSNKDASKKFLFKKMVLNFCFKILF